MDIEFTQEDLAFREEVREFIANEFTEAMRNQLGKGMHKDTLVSWQKALYKKGWIAPHWPEEFGGTGWSITKKFIFDNEIAAAGAPNVSPFGLKMVAPVIYTFGNEEQKKKFLPRILSSDDWWCQGYSEPGAGSDLAALQTKAERDGDDYIVNGSKIWTTYAQYADWIFCLVRTDPNAPKKQQGISFLLIDMATPGISVNPIVTIDDQHTLNEVHFENVRVPVENRIGEENKGWTYAKALLSHERTAIAGVATSKRNLKRIKDLAKGELIDGTPIIQDQAFKTKLADIEIELMALEYTELRTLAAVATGGAPGPESSILKIKGTEIQQSIQELQLELAGQYGGVLTKGLESSSLDHEFNDAARTQYMYGRASTIYGGSNEIQKNIIAKMVLGL